MSKELDTKLKEIYFNDDISVEDHNDEIEQAFIDDGYTKIDKREYRDEYGKKYMQYTFNGGYARVPMFDFMTGQEWYERFKSELWEPPELVASNRTYNEGEGEDRFYRVSGQHFMKRRALEAAYRASGLPIEETK